MYGPFQGLTLASELNTNEVILSSISSTCAGADMRKCAMPTLSPPPPDKGCQRSLFCSKLHGDERKTSERASVTASVTCEGREAQPRVARASKDERKYDACATYDSRLRMSRSRTHVSSCSFAFLLAFLLTNFRAKETAGSLP